MALSLGTSIDAMVVGGSFTAMGLHPLYTSLIIGGVTFGVCMVGVYIAGKASCLRRDILEMAGGSVLIMIGIKVLFEHRDHIFRF